MPAAIIGYIRVSTDKQGKSGLGLEAQREAIARFAAAESLEVAGEFIEVETRKGADALDKRPQLAAALRRAKQRGVVLGNPNVGKMITEAAAARDAKLKPVLEAMRGKPYREIAEGLTSRNIPTPRGGDAWNAMSVMRAMKRLLIRAVQRGSTPRVISNPSSGIYTSSEALARFEPDVVHTFNPLE